MKSMKRERLYEYLLSKDGKWVNLNEIVDALGLELRMTRALMNQLLSTMIKCNQHPGLAKSSRRLKSSGFSSVKPVYSIKYRVKL